MPMVEVLNLDLVQRDSDIIENDVVEVAKPKPQFSEEKIAIYKQLFDSLDTKKNGLLGN